MNRLNDLSAIEARLLELCHTTDAKISAPTLAYFAPCSVENAGRVLDDLAARGQLRMDVEDDGSITYELFGRQKLGPTPLRREVALAPVTRRELARQQRTASPLLAAFLSFWIPGAGQLYAGRAVAAVLWFLVVGAGYTLILPGLILHLFCIASAASSARRAEPLLLSGDSRVRGLLAA